jgi:hypothetical protein
MAEQLAKLHAADYADPLPRAGIWPRSSTGRSWRCGVEKVPASAAPEAEAAVFEQQLASALQDLAASVDAGDAQTKIDAFLQTLFSSSRAKVMPVTNPAAATGPVSRERSEAFDFNYSRETPPTTRLHPAIRRGWPATARTARWATSTPPACDG